MSSKTKSNKAQQGFTIIEVLIVLAIAGLIMLIVFLAVPALNRNSRNNQYRNEASQLLTAATEWSNNSNGDKPTDANEDAIMGLTKNKTLTELKIRAYGDSETPGENNFSKAVLLTSAKCASGGVPAKGTPRGYALLYNVEKGDGTSQQACIES